MTHLPERSYPEYSHKLPKAVYLLGSVDIEITALISLVEQGQPMEEFWTAFSWTSNTIFTSSNLRLKTNRDFFPSTPPQQPHTFSTSVYALVSLRLSLMLRGPLSHKRNCFCSAIQSWDTGSISRSKFHTSLARMMRISAYARLVIVTISDLCAATDKESRIRHGRLTGVLDSFVLRTKRAEKPPCGRLETFLALASAQE